MQKNDEISRLKEDIQNLKTWLKTLQNSHFKQSIILQIQVQEELLENLLKN